jgi:hypothetical protein
MAPTLPLLGFWTAPRYGPHTTGNEFYDGMRRHTDDPRLFAARSHRGGATHETIVRQHSEEGRTGTGQTVRDFVYNRAALLLPGAWMTSSARPELVVLEPRDLISKDQETEVGLVATCTEGPTFLWLSRQLSVQATIVESQTRGSVTLDLCSGSHKSCDLGRQPINPDFLSS